MNAELLTAHRVIAALECATGGSVQPTRVRALSAVIIEELAATAGGAPDDLIRSLLQNPQEPSSRRMISAAMVNETHFWRIPSHFEALRDDVFPRLAHEHPDRKIRVWSAACSIGPEAWSVAMAAVDAAVLHRPGVEILATDLDDSALELARAGRCGRWAQRGLLPEHADRWIQYDGEQATVSHQLTDLITFRNHNLLSPSPAGPFDVILCRNVLIYLSPASRRLVFANLMAVLAPDGVLLVAPAELEHTSVHGFAINAHPSGAISYAHPTMTGADESCDWAPAAPGSELPVRRAQAPDREMPEQQLQAQQMRAQHAVVRPAEPLVDAPDHAPAPQGRGSDDSHSLGREALDAGLVHRAVQLLRRAAALQPDVARIHADLAVAFLAVGSTPRAASAARRALEIAGTSSQHGAAEARQQALLVQVTLRGDR